MAALLLLATLSGPPAALAGPPAAAGPSRGWERKLDPFLRRMALGIERRQGARVDRLPARSRAAAATLPPFVQAQRDADDPMLFVRVRLDDGRSAPARGVAGPGRSGGAVATGRVDEGLAARLMALGIEVRGRAGPIVSLAVPASALEELATIDEVAWVRAARDFRLQNDVSASDTHTAARSAVSTFGLAGDGVIVAIVDTGIDWTSPDFRNADGTTRLIGIWDQTLASGAYPPPPGFGFGSYYSRAAIDAALAGGPSLPTQDGHGHGTHVAGTAAGNGRATGNGVPEGTFAGMAPRADLLVVRTFNTNGEFCAGCDLVAAVEFIESVAQAEGKPWVGNMSLGDDIGPHDGTSPEELAIDAVVRPGRPGAQMAIAAGNQGSSNRHFHWQGNLPAAGASTFTNFTLNSLTPNAGSNTDTILLDIWYRGSDSATVTVQTPGAQTVSAARGADSGVVCTTSGAVHVDATNAGDPENGENEVVVTISDSSACAPVIEPATGQWTVRLTTDVLGSVPGGPFDLWNRASTPRSLVGFGDGWVQLTPFSLAKSVTIPGTARHALTAGAYVSKTSWVNAAGTTSAPAQTSGSVGTLCSFSGIGPTRDGRTKPDFAAPGEWIGSTKSSQISAAPTTMERDNAHIGFFRGTSMASPHVAGAAALLLSLHPQFDAAEVRAALQRAARADLQTAGVPNNRFGWGKLRILEAAYDAAAMAAEMDAGADGQSFSWPGDPAMLSWNVYRGPLPGISATDSGTCFLSGLPSPDFTDAESPPVGEGFFYFVTGVYLNPTSGLPVEGSLGTDSQGRLRPNNAACP